MMEIRAILARSAMIVLTVAMVGGCGGGAPPGPKLYSITGTASFAGEPLKDADLRARTSDGKHAAGAKVTDGKFKLSVPAGTSIIEITAMRDVPGEFREENPGEKVAVKEQFIPAKYNTESTLKLEVKPDTKDAKFELTP